MNYRTVTRGEGPMEKRKSLKNTIYEAILSGIYQDKYKPEEILTEQSLVESFGVSKAPVREALLTLCNEGVLKNLPRLGYEVVKLTTNDVKEVLRFRCILECGCLEEICGKLTKEQLDTLQQLNKFCCSQASSENMQTHWQHNEAFHLQLIAYAGNAYAYQQLVRSLTLLRRAYSQFYWDKWTPSIISMDMKSHKPLIEALAKNDLDRAKHFLKEDLADFGY